jgi:hypothetical protein
MLRAVKKKKEEEEEEEEEEVDEKEKEGKNGCFTPTHTEAC